MAEGDASEGLLSRLGLRRGLASKTPEICVAEKNPELAPASLKQLDFFQQRRFPPPKKRTPPAEPAQTRRYLAG